VKDEEADRLRVDKWLWAARFFKTRPLAVEAINGGKVQVDGQRAKPGRAVRPGARLIVHKGELEWRIEIKALAKQRRPASEAVLLYQEDEDSRNRRQALMQERREAGAQAPTLRGRPTKRDRRRLGEFIGRQG
jgi:ribosome-associated heat shock protein Hsp15